MPETVDNRTLLRRTLVAVGAMVGACVVVVGTITLLASVIVGHAMAHPGDAEAADTPGLVPPTNIHGSLPGKRAIAATPVAK
jgi:hypothetical protein